MNTLKQVVVVLFVLLCALYLAEQVRTRMTVRMRGRRMEEAARALGWSLEASQPLDVIPGRTRFKFFRAGRTGTHTIHNFMAGRMDGVSASVFDYHVATGTGGAQSVVRRTVVHLRSPGLALPEFSVAPDFLTSSGVRGVLDSLVGGSSGTDLPDRPGFTGRYQLSGRDGSAVHALFSREVTDFFEQARQDWNAAGEGEDLLLWSGAWHVEAPEASYVLASGMELLTRLRAAADARA
jgi:hypothetical protein